MPSHTEQLAAAQDEIVELRVALAEEAETLVCRKCDAEPESIAAAKAAGWTDILEERDGMFWTFTGLCPDCARDVVKNNYPLFPESTNASACRIL